MVEIKVVGDQAVLTPKKLIDKSQAYFWTKEWQKAEQQAEEDLKAGRLETFDSIEELLEELDRERDHLRVYRSLPDP